jgi:hypothetical protein
MKLMIVIALCAGLAPALLPQTEKPNKQADVINVGARTEANAAPFGHDPDSGRYRQYYSPTGFNTDKPLQIEAVAFTSDPYPGGVGPVMLNVTITLGVAHTLVPPPSVDVPLEDAQVSFNGPLSTYLDGRPEDLRFPCMRKYHYRPDKGDVLVVDVIVHDRVVNFFAGMLAGRSPYVTRAYYSAANRMVLVDPGFGLYTTFEVK